MRIFFHCLLNGSSNSFIKIEWKLCDEREVIEEGEVVQDSPSSTFEFIMFLLAIGKADTLVGYDLNFKLIVLGRVMKKTGLSLEKPTKIVHLDLKQTTQIKKPRSVEDLYEGFFNSDTVTV
jgi:hypothetical protein